MQFNQSLRGVTFVIPIALVALFISAPAGAQTNYILNSVPPNYLEANTVLRDPTPEDEFRVFRGDDAWLRIELPFPFPFYGDTYSQAFVSTNGYINFLAGNSIFSNGCLFDAANPNGAIYVFWDDLVVDDSAIVRTELLGAAPSQQFVIEWRNVTFFADETRRVDFEIVLHETGAILLQYRNIDSDPLEMGRAATIGLENQPGTEATEFSCYPDSPLVGSTDNAGETDSPAIGPITPGEFALGTSEATTRAVPVDIKPMGCPNPLNVASKGVLPVAILGTNGFDGTARFDVTQINPETVMLEGIKPLRWNFEDTGTPYEPLVGRVDQYQCTALGPDGTLDMTFKFDSEAVAAALEPVNDGEVRVLQLRGNLLDGTEISGEDAVIIIKKAK